RRAGLSGGIVARRRESARAHDRGEAARGGTTRDRSYRPCVERNARRRPRVRAQGFLSPLRDGGQEGGRGRLRGQRQGDLQRQVTSRSPLRVERDGATRSEEHTSELQS